MKNSYAIPWDVMGMIAHIEGDQCGVVFRNLYHYAFGGEIKEMTEEGQNVFDIAKKAIDEQRSK